VHRIRNDEDFMAAELGESYVNYMATMIGGELAAALEETSQTNPVPGISDRRCDPRPGHSRVTESRNQEDPGGHARTPRQQQFEFSGVPEDTAGYSRTRHVGGSGP